MLKHAWQTENVRESTVKRTGKKLTSRGKNDTMIVYQRENAHAAEAR
jgi:hypothetical protein